MTNKITVTKTTKDTKDTKDTREASTFLIQRLPAGIKDKLSNLAEIEHRNISGQIVSILEQYFNK